MGKSLTNYTHYKQITHIHAWSLKADGTSDTLILRVTKVIVYSANHKPGTHAY